MKSLSAFHGLVWLSVVLLLPSLGHGQKVTTDKLEMAVQPRSQGEFQVHVKFDLPDFEKLAAQKTSIDHAVLEFEVQVLAVDSASVDILEVLLADESGNAPLSDLAYNANPMTARISRRQAGAYRVKVNITQLVELWAHNSISNYGLLLVSHRRQVDKALHLGQVVLSAEPRASATIFSTALD